MDVMGVVRRAFASHMLQLFPNPARGPESKSRRWVAARPEAGPPDSRGYVGSNEARTCCTDPITRWSKPLTAAMVGWTQLG